MASKAPANVEVKNSSVSGFIGNLNKKTVNKKSVSATMTTLWLGNIIPNQTEASLLRHETPAERAQRGDVPITEWFAIQLKAALINSFAQDHLRAKCLDPQLTKSRMSTMDDFVSAKTEFYIEVGEEKGRIHVHSLTRMVHKRGSRFWINYAAFGQSLSDQLGIPYPRLKFKPTTDSAMTMEEYIKKNHEQEKMNVKANDEYEEPEEEVLASSAR
jgi:hypothetical protein